MKYLFPNFLRDKNDFEKSKGYWKSICERILSENKQSNCWEVWFENNMRDSDLFDSLPIFSFINVEKTKAIIINQQDPRIHIKWEIVAYTKESDEYNSAKPLQYLVYNCNLTKKSADIFEKIFEKWVQPNYSKKKIEKFIESFEEVNTAIL